MSLVTIEITLLDFRYFLDEAFTFIEFFVVEDRSANINNRFQTNYEEIGRIRQYAIEYIRLIYDLKKLFWEDTVIKEYNLGINFSEQFKNKRVFFFKSIFERLEKLFNTINGVHSLSNDLVKLYYNTIQKLIRNTNEFIGYIENSRWHRQYALKALDNLVMLCNDFSAIFERFVESLEINRRIVKGKLMRNFDTNQNKSTNNSSSLNSQSLSTSSSSSSSSSSTCLIDLNSNKSTSPPPLPQKLQLQQPLLPKKQPTIKRNNVVKKNKKSLSSCLFIILILVFIIVSLYLIIYVIQFLLSLNYYFENSFYRFFLTSNTNNNNNNYFYTINKVKNSIFFDFTDSIRIIESSSSATLDLNSIYLWSQIFYYMTHFLVIFFCLFCYILFEFILK